ncbi:hypothetical protein KC19_11G091100, partial [Ceratodon purpureus]
CCCRVTLVRENPLIHKIGHCVWLKSPCREATSCLSPRCNANCIVAAGSSSQWKHILLLDSILLTSTSETNTEAHAPV